MSVRLQDNYEHNYCDDKVSSVCLYLPMMAVEGLNNVIK